MLLRQRKLDKQEATELTALINNKQQELNNVRQRINTEHTIIPMDIEEPPTQRTHLQKHGTKYIGGGIAVGAGIGTVLANLQHTGGSALADEVKNQKQQEWLDNQQTTIRNELADKLHLHNPTQFTKQFVIQNKAANNFHEQYGHDGWLNNYPHVGPGNKILSKATNAIDNVARNHDIAYMNSLTNEQIRAADREFIEAMKAVPPNTWGETAVKYAAIGGIKAKQLVEGTLGKTLYPSGLREYFINK